MTRRFVESLAAATGATSVKAVYPDAGVAAMLAHNWTDRTFAIDSLNARRPVSADDDLIVICCPDPFGAEECQRTVRQVAEQDEKAGVMDRPVVLFNQRLSRWGGGAKWGCAAAAAEVDDGRCWQWAEIYLTSGQSAAGQPERIAAPGGDLGSTNDACLLPETSSRMLTASSCWC